MTRVHKTGPNRVPLTADVNPLRSVPDLSALSDEQWVGYLIEKYPLAVVLQFIGLEPSYTRLHRPDTADQERLKRVAAHDRERLVQDLIGIIGTASAKHTVKATNQRSERNAPMHNATLSKAEWDRYLRSHLPRRVIRDLDGIEQSNAAVQRPIRPTSASRKRNRLHRGVPQVEIDRKNRLLTHAIVIGIALAIMGRNPTMPMLVGGFGITLGLLLLGMKDAVRFAAAFTVRSRSKTGSVDVTVSVKGAAWDGAGAAQILRLASFVLPAEYRAEYLEEQCGNLLASESGWERVNYLIDLVLNLPDIARQFYAERKRESVK